MRKKCCHLHKVVCVDAVEVLVLLFLGKVVAGSVSLPEQSSTSLFLLFLRLISCSGCFVDFCGLDLRGEVLLHLLGNDEVLVGYRQAREAIRADAGTSQLDFVSDWRFCFIFLSCSPLLVGPNHGSGRFYCFLLFLSRHRVVCAEDVALARVGWIVVCAEYKPLPRLFGRVQDRVASLDD